MCNNNDENDRVQYQGLLEALKSSKNQQWLISTYVLALQIGLVKLFMTTKSSISDIFINQYLDNLRIVTWGISILGSILVSGYSYKIYKYRKDKIEVAGRLNLKPGKIFDGFELLIILIFIFFYIGLAYCVDSYLITQYIIKTVNFFPDNLISYLLNILYLLKIY